jgi:hypothetical protein
MKGTGLPGAPRASLRERGGQFVTAVPAGRTHLAQRFTLSHVGQRPGHAESSLASSDPPACVGVRNTFGHGRNIESASTLSLVHPRHAALKGEVEWRCQRERAKRRVRELQGVLSLRNPTRVEPRVAPKAIKRKMETGLRPGG